MKTRIFRTFFKSFVSGEWLGTKIVINHLPSIIWTATLTVIYIANSFNDQSIHSEISRLNRSISNLSVTAATTRAEMISKSKESVIIQKIKERGIQIKEIETPPIVIKGSSKN